MEGVGQTISYQLGMHPLKIARLSSITVIMMKSRYLNNHWTTWETVAWYLNNHWTAFWTVAWKWMLQYAFYVYWREMEGVGQTISYPLGLCPLKLACLSSITLVMMKSRYLNNHWTTCWTVALLVGLLPGNESYNMLSLSIGERWKVWGRLFLSN
jgi:hypothetical protein